MEKNNKNKLKIKVKSKVCNNEVYSLLEFLSKTKYFGEVTLYFQNGNVEFIHQKVRLSKLDIKKTVKKIEMQKPNSKSNINVEQIESQLIFPLFTHNKKVEEIK